MPLFFTRRRPRRPGPRCATRSIPTASPTPTRCCRGGAGAARSARSRPARGCDATVADGLTRPSDARSATRRGRRGGRRHARRDRRRGAPARSRCARPPASSTSTGRHDRDGARRHPFAELDAALGRARPGVPARPASTDAPRSAASLARGPLRPPPARPRTAARHVLEVRFVTADGRVVKGGGPTVKNVTGYDIPRLFVGSLGTLGVLTQVTLRSRPDRAASQWFTASAPGAELRTRSTRPTAIAGARDRRLVLLEGHAGDLAAEAGAAGLDPGRRRRSCPTGAHRGRISVDPAALDAARRALDAVAASRGSRSTASAPCTWRRDNAADARRRPARSRTRTAVGCCARPARPTSTRSARPSRAVALQRRIRDALDPTGKLGPGRVPDRPDAAMNVCSTSTTTELVACVGCGLCLPHCPTYRVTGDEIASPARPHRGDARGQRRTRADRRRVRRRDGRVRPVPRLRGRVPVGRAVRPPHGGHPRRARAASVAAAPDASSGSRYRGVLPHRRVLGARPWRSRSASACTSSPRGSDCRACRCGRPPPLDGRRRTRTRTCSPAA